MKLIFSDTVGGYYCTKEIKLLQIIIKVCNEKEKVY